MSVRLLAQTGPCWRVRVSFGHRVILPIVDAPNATDALWKARELGRQLIGPNVVTGLAVQLCPARRHIGGGPE